MGKKQDTIDMVEVMVCGRKKFVPDSLIPVRDFKKMTNLPGTRQVVAQEGDQRIVLRDTDMIRPRNGNRFYDAPEYDAGSDEQRFLLEIFLLEKVYGKIKYDQDNHLWVCIPDFELPKGYNKKTSELLIELPAHYPFSPPTNFFMDRTITTRNGKTIEHYYPDREQNKYYDRGWGWFCVHIRNWKVKEDIMQSDNLLTSADIAYLTLESLIN